MLEKSKSMIVTIITNFYFYNTSVLFRYYLLNLIIDILNNQTERQLKNRKISRPQKLLISARDIFLG